MQEQDEILHKNTNATRVDRMPGSESNIKSRKRGTRPNQNVEHETTSEEEEQKLHGAPLNFHNLWSSPSPRQPLQLTGIETEEEVDLLGDPNLRCKPYEMRSNDRVITSPASVSSQSHLHVFTVPSVSSGSMKNVLDVDMDTSSPHYFRYYDASLGSNQYSYDSLRRYGKLWITLFVGLVSLGSIIAVLAVHVGSKVHAPVYTTRATIESISRAVQNEINTSQGIELGYLQSDNTMTTVPLTENALEEAFNEWAIFHKREYGSHDERRKRFHIWRENHLKTVEKNMRHGPCKKMKQHIFGDNHFKDLSPLEFKQKFLTGYKGAQYSEGQELTESARIQENYLKAMHPLEVERHPSVQAAYEMNWNSKGVLNEDLYKDSRSSNFSNVECSWWNISCLINWMASVFGLIPGSREPRYDANSYPSSVDWRSMGAVTSIHTQGNCGACWAITAVETIESAYYIKTGKLVDLAETEVIACDNSCEQCNGGWPQNAYEYVVKHNGLPAESELDFDASWLVDLTAVLAGESDVYRYVISILLNSVVELFALTCSYAILAKMTSMHTWQILAHQTMKITSILNKTATVISNGNDTQQ